jgi:hypothetical protein
MRDIEDIDQILLPYTARSSSNSLSTPLILDVEICKGQRVYSKEQIKRNLDFLLTAVEPNHEALLRVNTGLTNIGELNQRILYLTQIANNHSIIVEASPDRLILLLSLEESCFLNPRTYPSLKYYLQAGEESKFLADLSNVLEIVGAISGLTMALTLGLSAPFPDFTLFFTQLRNLHGRLRFVTLSLERNPIAVSDALRLAQPLPPSDPFALVMAIERGSKGDVTRADILPVSILHPFETLLKALGFPHYALRPAPTCGWWFALVSTPESHTSVPVTKFYDMWGLHHALKPLSTRLHKAGKLNLLSGMQLRRAVRKCVLPHVDIPDTLKLLRDSKSKADVDYTVDHTQFWFIHNTMDMASLDLRRRAQCTFLSEGLDGKMAASCTGCV